MKRKYVKFKYDSLIKMEPKIWLILQLEPNQLVASGYTKTNKNQMAHLKNTKQGLWKKDMNKKKICEINMIPS